MIHHKSASIQFNSMVLVMIDCYSIFPISTFLQTNIENSRAINLRNVHSYNNSSTRLSHDISYFGHIVQQNIPFPSEHAMGHRFSLAPLVQLNEMTLKRSWKDNRTCYDAAGWRMSDLWTWMGIV